ncbi:serine hydrolase [Aquicella lusitana]|uniref:Beta-lactamase class C n=1 Tax=Aquicella lusitana TaxID=254246 RepID=A0A370GFS7_9COXI|nr:serine hydrolase [Aquicella lusitana]RDI42537.1 beta-lactamase class C [Aquicella lusitana]VVC74316.1 Beta-lactamase [Aquicella lusitana]
MNKLLRFLMTGLLLLVPFYASAETLDADAETVKQEVTALMKEHDIPGAAVEIYVDGKPRSYYFGFANQEKKTPVTKLTIFEVGSITKIMTSLLLAQEVDAAKVQLDDPVTKFMSSLPGDFDDMTLKSLATHVSGLPFDAPSIQDQTAFENYLGKWKPTYSAGDKWTYSNVGIGMLGMALESVTHKNYNQLYRSQILSPLKMQPIALSVPQRLQRYYAQGYNKDGKPVNPLQLGLFAPAYGFKLSADDMHRFLGAAIGLPGTPERIFYPMRMTQTAYVKLNDMDQGLGWLIHPFTSANTAPLLSDPAMELGPLNVVDVYDKPVFNGEALIDKTGSTDGFRTYIAVLPNRKSGIAIMINKNVPGNAVVHTARKILFDLANASGKVNHETNKPESAQG